MPCQEGTLLGSRWKEMGSTGLQDCYETVTRASGSRSSGLRVQTPNKPLQPTGSAGG